MIDKMSDELAIANIVDDLKHRATGEDNDYVTIRCDVARRIVDLLSFHNDRESFEPVINSGECGSNWYACRRCKQDINPGDHFCRHCGRHIYWKEIPNEAF